MSEEQIDWYRTGYWDCRAVLREEIRGALKDQRNTRLLLEGLVEKLDQDERDETWTAAQEEQPDITREEYEVELERDFQEIREKYYRKDGRLKMRLVNNGNGKERSMTGENE